MAIEKVTTPDNLTVFVEHVPTVHTLSASLVVKSGSIHEPDELAGISHALEHAVHLKTPFFKSATDLEDFADEHAIYTNAATTYKKTEFETSGLDSDAMFRLLGQVAFQPLFGKSEVVREMKAIRREAKTDLEDIDELSSIFQDHTLHGLPFGRSIIGYADRLHFTEQQLIAYYRQMYKVGNMALIVVGNIQPEEVLELADKHFDMSNHQGDAVKPTLAPDHSFAPGSYGFIREDTDNARISISIRRTPEMNVRIKESVGAYNTAVSLVSKRLYDELRGGHGLSYDGDFASYNYLHPSAARLSANVTVDSTKTRPALTVIEKVMRQKPKTYSDLEIQRKLSMRAMRAAFKVDNILGRAENYADQFADDKDPVSADTSLEKTRNITVQQVRSALELILESWGSEPKFRFVTGSREAVGHSEVIDQSQFA